MKIKNYINTHLINKGKGNLLVQYITGGNLKMIALTNYSVSNFDGAIRGMRNPMFSWDKSDSFFEEDGTYIIGKNDLELATKLVQSGSSHRKFLRQIFLCVDINAPLYWWKEMDQYKVSTTTNSCSTMHKLHANPITLEMFSTDHMSNNDITVLKLYLDAVELHRKKYVETKNKDNWYAMIQMLPSSFNQLRTITMDYETLYGMYFDRRNHKLNEWRDFTKFIEELPYVKELFSL